MSFDGSGYYEVAKSLLKQAKDSPDEEAWLRSAISRAYYAAFLRALIHLRDKEYDPAIPFGADAHYYVKEKFRSDPDPDRNEIGEGLNTLRRLRNKADYGDALEDLIVNTPLWVMQAGIIMSLVDAL